MQNQSTLSPIPFITTQGKAINTKSKAIKKASKPLNAVSSKDKKK